MKIKTINLRTLLSNLALPLAVGVVGAFFVMSGIEKYNLLQKPPLTPPSAVFGIVWTVLYILMGIAAYLVKSSDCYDKQSALQLHYIQLALNLMWTFFYFRLGMYLVAALVLIALIFAVVFTIIRFSQCCVTAGRLMLPYLIWCLFALYLNIAIVVIN
ncbi:MAG: TspO/MBR family protein [Acutalibacteraceae bacterium]|nr:TspO/MBR family protein [Acutalibacteraceae bacterium]